MPFMMKIILFLAFALHLFASPKIAVSIAPEAWIVSQIVGESNTTFTLLPKNASPESYRPKPKDLLALKKAEIYFTIGVPFEKRWKRRLASANEKLEFVDIGKGVKRIGDDPHIWLSPENLKIMAHTVMRRLSQRDPASKDRYEKNYKTVSVALDQLKAKLQKQLENVTNKVLLTFHPSFGYFAKAFGLEQIAIEREGHEPSIKYQIAVIKRAREMGIKQIIISPSFSQKEARFIAQKIGAKIVVIDHLGFDVPQTLTRLVESLAKAD